MAAERSLERIGSDRFDVLLLHNPDRTGYTSEVVWDGMAALRDEGLTAAIGIAPGPANGFTLDLLDCFERFGERIDWAMVILNPLEPWPGELVLDAAADNGIGVITRVVDYGGLFWGDVTRDRRPPGARPPALPARRAGSRRGLGKLAAMRPIAERHGLTTMQLACQWNLAHPAVRCVAPTLIQEAGDGARPIEDKRAELAALPAQQLTGADVAEIRDDRRQPRLDGPEGRQPRARGRDPPRPLAGQPRVDRRRRTLGRARRARPREAPVPRVSALDRARARLVSGPLGRGTGFAIDLRRRARSGDQGQGPHPTPLSGGRARRPRRRTRSRAARRAASRAVIFASA